MIDVHFWLKKISPQSLNRIIYSNDPSQIPLADLEAAYDMPYDTDVDPDAEILDIGDALRNNAFKLTKINAVQQVQQMVDLIDDIAETTIVNSVEGEEMRTSAPLGVNMIMSKLGGQSTVGRDIDGDGIPDRKLRFEFDNSDTVVQFPLGFCPSAPERGMIKKVNCKGRWGFVIKEWETITAVSRFSAVFITFISSLNTFRSRSTLSRPGT